MTQTAHTSLPLRLETDGRNSPYSNGSAPVIWSIFNKDGKRVFVLSEGAGNPEATGRFIVRACNSHYEMLEALKEAEAGLEFAGADKIIPEGDFVPTPTLALRSVRAAIARATGAA